MKSLIAWKIKEKKFDTVITIDYEYSEVVLMTNQTDRTYQIYNEVLIFEHIGLEDINNNKIYADSSICKVNYFSSSDWISDYCYFSFDTENLRFQVHLINEKEIVDFEASYFDGFEIIDTIQQNNLGLIK